MHDVNLLFLLETHSSGDKAKRTADKMGLDNAIIIDANGQSGGIWCLWNSHVYSVTNLVSSTQLLHLAIQKGNETMWNITTVYASPSAVIRRELWNQLLAIKDIIVGPWCLLGDFNTTLHDHERVGSSTAAPRGSDVFRDFVRDCGLIDAGFVGTLFTWKRGRLHERLDRVLCNLDWRIKYPFATVFHLHHLKSDYNPLLLKLQNQQRQDPARRPFRFQAAWLSHEQCVPFLRNAWTYGGN
ncbi:uncharacterized protein LOC130736610 [Lotus japonicus]|uniref:uncharacterized protein LOC130736610 n=1 Tax=Lotus japonicus TaxID=34305 RepID=UPI00258627C1|nr:uncharacterized protein LOC130736610 [Lotus japonicus]